MKNFEKPFFTLIFGMVFPFIFCLILMIIWFYLDKSEDRVLFYSISGLLIGVLLDIKYLKGWVKHRYDLPIWSVAGFYVVYNIIVYGLFMGFPVFNIFLGFIAGYYFGKRSCYNKQILRESAKLIKKVSLFTGFIMLLICISSAILALLGDGAGGDIQSMLGLHFVVTRPMIWGIIFVGGISLILIQIQITRWTIIKTIKHF